MPRSADLAAGRCRRRPAGPAAEPLDVPEPGRHGHPQPQPRPRAGPVPPGDLDLQAQPAHPADHRTTATPRSVAAGATGPAPPGRAPAHPVHPMPQPVQPDPPPHRRQRLPMVPLVVVGRRPPQVQHRLVDLDLPDPHQPPGSRVEGPGSHHQAPHHLRAASTPPPGLGTTLEAPVGGVGTRVGSLMGTAPRRPRGRRSPRAGSVARTARMASQVSRVVAGRRNGDGGGRPGVDGWDLQGAGGDRDALLLQVPLERQVGEVAKSWRLATRRRRRGRG